MDSKRRGVLRPGGVPGLVVGRLDPLGFHWRDMYGNTRDWFLSNVDQVADGVTELSGKTGNDLSISV